MSLLLRPVPGGLIADEIMEGIGAGIGFVPLAILAVAALALALEFGERVRFNAVCPGQIATRMMARVIADADRLAALTRRIPAGRLGEAGEVAATVCWLLSAQASFINGAVLTVDGGETAGYRTPPLPGAPRA